MRIAVADDERDMQQYFRTMLPRLGHDVVAVCQDGLELVEQCARLQPELVITDLKMPHMDGIEAAALIFNRHPVPVIVLSAYLESPLIDHSELAKVLIFLEKPVKQEDLRQAILSVTEQFRQVVGDP